MPIFQRIDLFFKNHSYRPFKTGVSNLLVLRATFSKLKWQTATHILLMCIFNVKNKGFAFSQYQELNLNSNVGLGPKSGSPEIFVGSPKYFQFNKTGWFICNHNQTENERNRSIRIYTEMYYNGKHKIYTKNIKIHQKTHKNTH